MGELRIRGSSRLEGLAQLLYRLGAMHILYVDESGSVGNPDEQFFVLALRLRAKTRRIVSMKDREG